jgi:type 1 fimbria pilin
MKKLLLALAGIPFLAASPAIVRADDQPADNTISVTGEILDMACYTDHGAHGEKHAACAQKCIASGLPVGIKSDADGKVYIVIGDHKPMNDVLADYAAKTVTLKGKAVTRDGVNLLENAEIVK